MVDVERLKVAGCSTENLDGQVERNLKNIEKWVKVSVNKGAELVCFSELSVCGYWMSSDIWSVAERIPGAVTNRLIEIARTHRVYITAGMAEKEDNIVYNTQVLVGPKGLTGKQRKLHIGPGEFKYYKGGNKFSVFDIGKCKIGISICYDNLLPEDSRILALMGAEVLIMPWCCAPSTTREWHNCFYMTCAQARAADNGLWVVGVNAAGCNNYYPGHAWVLEPHGGRIVAETKGKGNGEKMVMAELYPEPVIEKRQAENSVFKIRRPEIYGKLVERR